MIEGMEAGFDQPANSAGSDSYAGNRLSRSLNNSPRTGCDWLKAIHHFLAFAIEKEKKWVRAGRCGTIVLVATMHADCCSQGQYTVQLGELTKHPKTNSPLRFHKNKNVLVESRVDFTLNIYCLVVS